MPYGLRDELRNHFQFGYTPCGKFLKVTGTLRPRSLVLTMVAGASFVEAFLPVFKAFRELMCRPFRMHIAGIEHTVYLSMLFDRYDMPEALKACGVLSVGATRCCRFCLTPKEEFFDMSLSPVRMFEASRNLSKSNAARSEAAAQRNNVASAEVLKRSGLSEEVSIYEYADLPFDPHSQTPVEIAHANVKALSLEMLLVNVFAFILSAKAVTAISKPLAQGGEGGFPMPKTYTSLRSPTYIGSYTFYEGTMLVSIGAPLLQLVLPTLGANFGIKLTALEAFKAAPQSKSAKEIFQILLRAFVLVHRTNYLTLNRDFAEEDFQQLENDCRAARQTLLELFDPIEKVDLRRKPNFHTGLHITEGVRFTGSPLLMNVSIDEMAHKLPKGVVAHTNKATSMETAFLRLNNRRQGIRLVLARHDNSPFRGCLQWLREHVPRFVAGGYYDNVVDQVPRNATTERIGQDVENR